jgi:hypothetical protein
LHLRAAIREGRRERGDHQMGQQRLRFVWRLFIDEVQGLC